MTVNSITFFNTVDLSPVKDHFHVFLLIFTGLLILYALGIGKMVTAFVVFLFVEILQRSNPLLLNGGDNLLKFAVIYLIFCDSYSYLSLTKIHGKEYLRKGINFLTRLGLASLTFHLALIYFISGISKLHSDVWYKGTAIYYILVNNRFLGADLNKTLVQFPLLVMLATYGTILFEISFIFLIRRKRLKPYVLLCGVIMHLAIYFFMMIHDFEILFIMFYGFFFSDSELRAFFQRIISWLLPADGEIMGPLQNEIPKYLILFDGVCNVCNRSIQFVFRHDQSKQFHFSSLQSDFSNKMTEQLKQVSRLSDSMIFIVDNKYYTKSNAWVKMGFKLGPFWLLSVLLVLIPRYLRDAGYDIIAKHRYKLFRGKDHCRMAPSSFQQRFLS